MRRQGDILRISGTVLGRFFSVFLSLVANMDNVTEGSTTVESASYDFDRSWGIARLRPTNPKVGGSNPLGRTSLLSSCHASCVYDALPHGDRLSPSVPNLYPDNLQKASRNPDVQLQ
jgi:hypothetical protein